MRRHGACTPVMSKAHACRKMRELRPDLLGFLAGARIDAARRAPANLHGAEKGGSAVYKS
jgi:hypothetical protein